jgi:hypothetical protein
MQIPRPAAPRARPSGTEGQKLALHRRAHTMKKGQLRSRSWSIPFKPMACLINATTLEKSASSFGVAKMQNGQNLNDTFPSLSTVFFNSGKVAAKTHASTRNSDQARVVSPHASHRAVFIFEQRPFAHRRRMEISGDCECQQTLVFEMLP